MRFMVQSDNRRSYFNLITIVIFFFGVFFWISDLLYVKNHYGFNYEEIYIYFFGDFEYPEPISAVSLLEDIHIYMFLYFMFNILFLPLFIRILPSERLGIFYSLLIFASSFTSLISDLLTYYINPSFIYLRIFSYFIYKISSLIALITLGLLPFVRKTNIYISAINVVVVLFALGSIFFLSINFWMFLLKMGFSPESIFYYYNGNPEQFIKGKSLEGLLTIFTAHVLAGAVFIFVMGHFFIFCKFPYKKHLFVIISISMFVEFIGGFLIKTGIMLFSYLKVVAFIFMEISLIFMAFYIIKDIIKGKLVWTYRRSLQEQ